MHRPGADPDSMAMEDILCDFCQQPWTMQRHMVEGHKGACICGNCLTIAWTELIDHKLSDEPAADEACCLCRETGRSDPHWRSPIDDEKVACRRCVKQSAGVLHKDKDIEWAKPSPG